MLASNVFNIAVEGNFDDCQDLVKAMFNDLAFRDEMKLTAVNSINFARIMAQIAYYFWAAVALGAPHRPVRFAVPTGNFGNVYSGYAAREMGLPISHMQIGSNRNDILTRFFETGAMKIAGVEPSLSPSMDIQVSSNFERLLFDLFGRRGPAVAETMTAFRDKGVYEVGGNAMAAARKLFSAYRLSDQQTLAMVGEVHKRTGEIVDPHSAIGIAGPWQHQTLEDGADHRAGHRASGEIPRRGRAGHRHPPATAGRAGRSADARGALRCAAQRCSGACRPICARMPV